MNHVLTNSFIDLDIEFVGFAGVSNSTIVEPSSHPLSIHTQSNIANKFTWLLGFFLSFFKKAKILFTLCNHVF